MARNSRELARRPAVDPREEPSVGWGWHAKFPTGLVGAGLVSILFLFLLIFFGHDKSGTEIAWLVAVIVLIAGGLVSRALRRRHAWRR